MRIYVFYTLEVKQKKKTVYTPANVQNYLSYNGLSRKELAYKMA